ncbi:hypothetical protein EBZ38_03990 [bacterium]|nr:hypothetical protein [bacterium]
MAQKKDKPMPNNQDTVKLLPNVTFDDVCEDKELCEAIRNAMLPAIEAVVYRSAMVAKQFALQAITLHRAPTPREQELEAQNKALWELVSKIVGANNLRVAHGDETYLGAAMMEADAAIQKAKGSR